MAIVLSIDNDANAAYLRLNDRPVASTREVVLVDLDEYGVVVGVEMLDLEAPIPFDTIIRDHHVDTATIEALHSIRPNVTAFVSQLTEPAHITMAQPGRLQLS